MQPDTNKPAYAGGILIFIGFLLGAGIGISQGQPSLGSILGVAGGAVIAALLWLRKRSRAD